MDNPTVGGSHGDYSGSKPLLRNESNYSQRGLMPGKWQNCSYLVAPTESRGACLLKKKQQVSSPCQCQDWKQWWCFNSWKPQRELVSKWKSGGNPPPFSPSRDQHTMPAFKTTRSFQFCFASPCDEPLLPNSSVNWCTFDLRNTILKSCTANV